MESYTTRQATAGDLPDILGVQQRAFGRVADEYGIPRETLPPLVESLSDLQQLIASGVRFFVAESSGTGAVIGSVRADLREDSVHVGRLVVDDGWTRRGVATALMDLLEASFPDARRFELFTGADATVPMTFYANRGYREYLRENVGAYVLAWLEKSGPGAVS